MLPKISVPAFASDTSRSLHEEYMKLRSAAEGLNTSAARELRKMQSGDPATAKLPRVGEREQFALKILRAELAALEAAPPVLESLERDAEAERRKIIAETSELTAELRTLLFNAGWHDFKPEFKGQVGLDFLFRNERVREIARREGNASNQKHGFFTSKVEVRTAIEGTKDRIAKVTARIQSLMVTPVH